MSDEPRVLVAGIGNVFLGDDGFGPAVALELERRKVLPPQATIADFGIRGFDLTYALLDGWDAVVLVDVTRRGRPPGTLYVIEPEAFAAPEGSPALDMHGMQPGRVLALVKAMGGEVGWIRLVACEPESFAEDEGLEAKLSAPVRGAVEPAIQAVVDLVYGYLQRGPRAEVSRHA